MGRVRRKLNCLLMIMVVIGWPVVAADKVDRSAIRQLEPFLAQHCYDCHDDDVSKGDLDLFNLEFRPENAANFALWERVFDRVISGEMPPEKKPRPEAGERKAFLTGLGEPLMQADRKLKAAEGRVRVRRLTRREYEYTMHDLLGIDLPLQEVLPADQKTHGFDTVAEGQQLSHFLLNSYLNVADQALDHALERALQGDDDWRKHWTPEELREWKARGNYRGPELRDGRLIAYRARLQFYGRMMPSRIPGDGWYRVTVHDVEAVNPVNGVVWGTLKSGALMSHSPMMYPVGIIEATKTKRDLTYEAWIRDDHRLELKANDATLKQMKNMGSGGHVSYKGVDNVERGAAGISFSGITVERIYPNGSAADVRKKMFGDANPQQLQRHDGAASRQLVERLVRRFADRAFRRPVTTAQSQPYVDLALAMLAEPKAKPVEALRVGYRAILCSPRFLTFVEKPGKLDDYAIASRLSYAFWNTMPDERLLAVAKAGKLRSPQTVVAETKRLLADPRSERFYTSLTDQWLTLSDINFTSPDRRMFSTWDGIVQESMVAETRAFVRELIEKNLSVANLVDSDFGMLNERLAKHYRLKDVKTKPGEGIQKVSLKGTGRGGLVTQGAVLKVTANGTTTSPVIRGVWVSERILGLHIPPPPANVPAVEPDIRGAVSIRDQLKKHNASENCASCHKKIDPAGFALENFDPVGLWRQKYGRGKNAATVDPSGVTPHGKAFTGIGEWKSIYAARPEQLTEAFATHLVTYTTGAVPGFSDRGELQRIVKYAGKNKYGMGSTLRAVVTSDLFLSK